MVSPADEINDGSVSFSSGPSHLVGSERGHQVLAKQSHAITNPHYSSCRVVKT